MRNSANVRLVAQPVVSLRAVGAAVMKSAATLLAGVITAVALVTLGAPSAAAQVAATATTTTGRIVGRIIDAASGQPVVGAVVQVVGSTPPSGAMSAVNGRFTIMNVSAGTTTLSVRFIGYAQKTVTGLLVPAGGVLEQDISMTAATPQLTAISVTATKEKGTVSDALNQQKNATNVVNAITAEQIARSPDSDAAQAAQRVSGVTVQDGKFLQARGMSERYTTASLNGARIPSPEPERKVVPLDLFPASLLQEVTLSKTFTPDQPGDFAGANVNIRTREFPAARQINYSASFGGNDRVLGKSLPFASRAGGELFGFAGAARNIPAALAATNFTGNVTQSQYNQITAQQRNVWTAAPRNGGGTGSFGASTGGNTILGQRIGYVLSGNYGYSEETRADERYAVGQQGANNTVLPVLSLAGSTGRSSIQWGGIANFSTMVGTGSRIALNTTATRSADNEARVDRGFDANLGDSIARTTLRYVERGVSTATLQGEHQLGARNKTSWAGTLASTTRREPDRSDVVYSRGSDGKFVLLGSLDGARRLYFDLNERNSTGQVDHVFNLGATSQNMLKVGAYYRATDRTANAPIFAFITRAPTEVLTQRPEEIFGSAQACDFCNVLNVQPIGQSGSYDATDRTTAGYAMADWGLGERIRVIAGARVESADITVNANTQGGFIATAKLDDTDVLPSLLVNTKLTETQNLRLGVTRTLSRPEYRELAPITFRDVLGGVSVTGNDKLVRSLINNYDVRYEYFPNSGEVLSVGVFAKQFDKPIERVESATSGAYQARYQNAVSATNVGVELEARKQLGFLGSWLEPFSGFTNVTIMKSSVSLDTTAGLSVTDQERALVGQAPYVVNAGVTYSTLSGRTNATLLFNVVGERIVAAGVLPLPNIVEKPRR
ncbi:MAG TPA: TonB-dependent receptor, partial [Gemmatimonas sp.]|nr:TonB-dependent receptor [Gemmatimonas sp.]